MRDFNKFGFAATQVKSSAKLSTSKWLLAPLKLIAHRGAPFMPRNISTFPRLCH